ncbi:GNAT family N-acetyltransferase [Cesiribacter andamanensis]|uniref:GNAT family N-acetyltransferase n=1 Tax=Cesiribacter andamanensis TaxID=649507 RepID=UPI001378FF13|nr:GNAT family N-acetyltransferase [Cesiribacter andamanensis]
MAEISVQPITPDSLTRLAGSGSGLFYSARWLGVLVAHYGFRLWQTTDAEGGYMLFAEGRGVLGPKLISLPFSDYTLPPLSPGMLPRHLAALRRQFPHTPLHFKCAGLFASLQQLESLGAPVSVACLHRIPLNGQPAPPMSASFLRGVRKALRGGLRAQCSHSEESLLQFYRLYYRLRTEKLGLIPQPFSFFQRVWEQFIKTGEGFIYEVRQQEEVLASAIVLRSGEALYYKWGCSATDRLRLRPNNLLFWELIRKAAGMGCPFLDLGLSDLDETRGLIRFKSSMGGQQSPIWSWSLYPEGYPLELEQKFKGMVSQLAHIVVSNRLEPAQTQAFSQALYPLFV